MGGEYASHCKFGSLHRILVAASVDLARPTGPPNWIERGLRREVALNFPDLLLPHARGPLDELQGGE
jgi:hypothetical protein